MPFESRKAFHCAQPLPVFIRLLSLTLPCMFKTTADKSTLASEALPRNFPDEQIPILTTTLDCPFVAYFRTFRRH